MRRWVAAHRKALAIALLGVLEVAAYVIADPGELPDWVVTLAAAVNVLGVYLAPRNAGRVTREDLRRATDYFGDQRQERHVRRDEVAGPPRRHVRGDKRPGQDLGS
jgi:hypothetical protein